MLIINRRFTMGAKLRYGIIGTGNIAMGKHLPGYAARPDDVEIVAACDINPERLASAAAKFNIPVVTNNYKELLARQDIDFVSICLPNYLHAPVAIEALRAGKHVHSEKPMAINAAKAQEMIDARNETGKQLMIGLNNRFRPDSQYMKQYIDAGNLGEIYLVKCGCTRRLGLPANEWFQIKEFSGGGVLIDLGVHFIDIVMYCMNYPKPISISAHQYNKFGGGPLAELYAFENGGKPEWRYDVEDLIIGNIELEGDIHVSYELSWASNIPEGETYWEFYGTKGNFRFNNGDVTISTVINNQFADIKPIIRPHMYTETEFGHFINSIRTGKAPTIANPEQGVKSMQIIDTIYRAANEKKQIMFEG